jgi:hypothetical protein
MIFMMNSDFFTKNFKHLIFFVGTTVFCLRQELNF